MRPTFSVGFSVLLLAIVVAGFAPTFFLRHYIWPRADEYFARHGPELPLHLVIHGIVLTTWFMLALVQPLLIAGRRTRLHRRIGVGGIVVAGGVVATGIVTVVLRDAPVLAEVSAGRPAGNLISLFGFAICVTLGIAHRRRPAEHMRLMLIASIWVVGPAVTRLGVTVSLATQWFSPGLATVFTFVVILSLLATVVLRDLLKERRLYRGTALGLLSIPLAIGCTLALIRSGAWVRFVGLFA